MDIVSEGILISIVHTICRGMEYFAIHPIDLRDIPRTGVKQVNN